MIIATAQPRAQTAIMKILRRLSIAALFALGFSPAFGQVPPVVPALPDTPRLTSYTIAGTTCTCAVNFALYGNANLADYQDWVEVFLNGVRVAYNDPTYGWTITSPTGALASIARPVTDAVLTFTGVQTGTVEIVGAARPARLSQWSENQGVSARNLNVAFTGIVAQLREVWDKINDVSGRDLKSQPGNTVGMLPLPAACSNAFLGFDSTGLNPLCRVGTGSGNVVGPVTSTVGDLALWNNATGSLLKDAPLSANLLAFFQTPTSANLAAAVPDETGTGPLVFGIAPTITLPNATGLPIAGISGLGTNVATALGNAANAAGGVAAPSNATGSDEALMGGASTPSYVAINNCATALTYSTSTHAWGCNSSGGTGNVVGPASSTSGDLPDFGDGTGKLLADSGVLASSVAKLAAADQTLSGGATLTVYANGSSSFTVDCGKNPGQYVANTGAITITAPANDGVCDVQLENGSGAGAVTWSGFTEGSNTGDALDTTNGHKFLVGITRIHGTSHYLISALQ